ncbi:MAG: LLM class flavin-dependent oxidoreductase [Nitrososphaerales archaeon]
MRLGFSLGTLLTHGEVIHCAEMADKTGAESIWIPESWARDAFVTLGRISAVTEHTRLGTGIVSIYSRSPAAIAMAAATLDLMCNGRAFIGLGASSKVLVENWHGEKFSNHITRMKEYVESIRAIVKGEKVNYDGRIVKVRNFKLGFKPHNTNIPIYVAATNERMVNLSTEVGDGTVLFLRPLDELKHTVTKLKKITYNRNFDIICIIMTAVAKERELARERIRKTLAFYMAVGSIYSEFLSASGFRNEIAQIVESYNKDGLMNIHKLIPDKMLDALTIAGEPEECRKKLGKFLETGISLPVIQFNPVNQAESSFKEVIATFLE